MSEDILLINAISDKDRDAFADLYQKYQPALLRYCGRLLNHDIEMAADIVDDVFFEVWQKSASFRGDASVKSWLFSIAHNKAVSFIRKNREASLDNEEQINELVSPSPEQAHNLDAKQHAELLTTAIEQLSSEHKEALHLFYYSDMSVKEIALTLDINEQTVRTRLHYAKKALKPLLSSLGIDAEGYFDSGKFDSGSF